jgi:hypothetical protein
MVGVPLFDGARAQNNIIIKHETLYNTGLDRYKYRILWCITSNKKDINSYSNNSRAPNITWSSYNIVKLTICVEYRSLNLFLGISFRQQ